MVEYPLFFSGYVFQNLLTIVEIVTRSYVFSYKKLNNLVWCLYSLSTTYKRFGTVTYNSDKNLIRILIRILSESYA